MNATDEEMSNVNLTASGCSALTDQNGAIQRPWSSGGALSARHVSIQLALDREGTPAYMPSIVKCLIHLLVFERKIATEY